MSYFANKHRYFGMIQNFLDSNVIPEYFCNDFISMWTQDRDEQYIKAQSWSEPFDALLLKAQEQGEISSEEFNKRRTELWGYADEIPFFEMLDKVHSSCYSYHPSPELSWEINAGKLEHEVTEAVSAYNTSIEF